MHLQQSKVATVFVDSGPKADVLLRACEKEPIFLIANYTLNSSEFDLFMLVRVGQQNYIH